MKRVIKTATALSLVIMLSACGISHRLKVADFDEAYHKADYCKATDVILGEKDICFTQIEKIDVADFDLDDKLNAGTTLFLAQQNSMSNAFFNAADTNIHESLTSTGIARGTAEVLVNASVVDYSPMIMDSIYLHSYTFLNALSMKDKAEARIQINRAYDRQQNAVQEFNKEIEKEKEAAAKEKEQLDKEAAASASKQEKEVLGNYKEFSKWKGYANFVNPYVTYLSGLYFMLNGASASDYETASTYLKRSSGMIDNKFVKEDLALAEKLANNEKPTIAPTVWIVFENGMVSNFKEFRIDLPVFIATSAVKTASLALPMPNEREAAYKSISASNDNKNFVQTEELTNVDNIFIAEFYKKLPTIVTKNVSKLALNTALQYAAQEALGDWGGIAAAAYSVTTAGADLRSWHSLPKNVQLAKVKKSGKMIFIYAEKQLIGHAEVSETGHSLVYVRIPKTGMAPMINVFEL